jgi:hypothetical protein
MSTIKEILPVARAMRQRIEELLEPAIAEKVIYDLDKLITRAELGKPVADEIFELLNAYEATGEAMRAHFDADKSVLLDNKEKFLPSKYVCPVPGGCRCRRYPNGWERQHMTDQPPICPKLKQPLVPA